MNSTFPGGPLWADEPLYCASLVALVVAGSLAAGILTRITAPYGRYYRSGWGPSIHARWAWVIMEAPSPLFFAAFWWLAPRPASTAATCLGVAYMVHYIDRAFIFPLRMRGGNKPKPLLTTVLAFVFNILNGGLNAYALFWLADHLGDGWVSSAQFVVGMCVFALGYGINKHSDRILRNLRRPGETGYKIPFGGMFRWISGANYFGEMIEWVGFAIASATAPACVFAFFTLCNLAPRAVSHHRWYQEHFEDYPPERRALIPWVY